MKPELPQSLLPLAMLPIHHRLECQSRIDAAVRSNLAEVAALSTLIGFGVLAATCTVCLDLKLRIPGHAIVRAVFPMAAGLALVPRHRAGTVMSVSAIVSALLFQACGFRVGTGAMTSLALIGPCLDACLIPVRNGWSLYLSFVLAGVICNAGAFVVRALTKLGSLEAIGTRPLASWLEPAIFTYLICGVVAGLVSAFAWFRFSARRSGPEISSRAES